MNKQPVSYLQTDKRWKSFPYRVKGETSTIGGSGCGPTAAAMAIETLTGRTFTPVDACKWSVDHGYKALNQGTYYGYFVPQFEAFGIGCRRLNGASVYHKPNSPVHDEMISWLKKGYYVIALMKKGTWTKGGHFVLVWWADNKIRINDPASTKAARLNGDVKTFRNEAAYYWLIDAREYNKEEDDMEKATFNAWWNEAMAKYEKEQAEKPVPVWAQNNGEWEAAKEAGIITSSTKPQALCTKAEAAAFALRAAKK